MDGARGEVNEEGWWRLCRGATTWTLGDWRSGIFRQVSFIPHKTRERVLICAARGPVEWTVDMWECFVILSWWG
jgi:hypothetical protein